MNIAKNMEGIFLAAVFLVTFTGFASAEHGKPVPAAAVQKADANIPTVVVSAKRLTAEEKAALGN